MESTDSAELQKRDEFFKKDIIKAICFCFAASLGWAIGAVMIEIATNKIDEIILVKEFFEFIFYRFLRRLDLIMIGIFNCCFGFSYNCEPNSNQYK